VSTCVDNILENNFGLEKRQQELACQQVLTKMADMSTDKLPFFARRLVELRTAAELSQYELAKRTGLTRQAMSLLELGERQPNWETVQRLAAILGTSCDSFTDPDMKFPDASPARGPGRPKTKADASLSPKRPRGRPRREK